MQQDSGGDTSADETYRELRRTAASDPRAAREQLIQLLDADSPHIDRLLELMKVPSEGRLRQLVANTARALRENKPVLDRLIPFLLAWQLVETDEFAKPAINAALQGLDLGAYVHSGADGAATTADFHEAATPLVSEEAVAIYRWVAGRLCHRVRNHLELPAAYLANVIHRAAAIGDDSTRADIITSLVEAQQAFRQIGRVVEFNMDDDHFRWRLVHIISWLRRMTERYSSQNEPIRLEFMDDVTEPGPSIMATDLLLEVVFWNLWRNAAQEADGDCAVSIGISMRNGKLHLLLSDNGPGLQAAQAEVAFKLRLSTHGLERGRGLLEVADAMQRLQGSARVVLVDGQYRIELLFPVADALKGT